MINLKTENRVLVYLGIAIIAVFFSCNGSGNMDDMDDMDDMDELTIGSNYQGGIIFYLDGNGGGLIAAPSDQCGPCRGPYVEEGVEGGCSLRIVDSLYFLPTEIGTGDQNTSAIVAKCGESLYAAKICANLTLGGYSDWFLPSKDELDLMYQNKDQIGGFSTRYYWSSSTRYRGPNLTDEAWAQIFGSGRQSPILRDQILLVRAIRAF